MPDPKPPAMTPVPHENALARLLERMTYTLEGGRFVLVGFPEAPLEADWAAVLDPPAGLVRERDETTLLVRAEHAAGLLARHPEAQVERGLAWIRFEAPMAWDVVGFLARVTSELAREGVPIGAVCGYSRDHLFVDERYLPLVRERLDALFTRPSRPTPDGSGTQ